MKDELEGVLEWSCRSLLQVLSWPFTCRGRGKLLCQGSSRGFREYRYSNLPNTRMKICVTEPCFRSVDMKLMGSELSCFRIDDVLPFSVNTKLLLLFVFTTFETPIRRVARGNYLAFWHYNGLEQWKFLLENAVILVTHLSCLKSIRSCIELIVREARVTNFQLCASPFLLFRIERYPCSAAVSKQIQQRGFVSLSCPVVSVSAHTDGR